MKAQKAFICSMVSVASSIRSNSFTVMPNSLKRCSGSPYVSQLFILITSTDKWGVRNMMRRINGSMILLVAKPQDRSNPPVDFCRLSQWIVDDIHIQLNCAVNVVPVLHHSILIGAQPNYHPHRQLLQGTHHSFRGEITK
jgi:hypothetical protein